MKQRIPFNKPYMSGKEIANIQKAHENLRLAGDGPFTRQCQEWLENKLGANKVLLTHSGTAALEMSALLMDIQPGDEVIMPSFTFVSTANAFALRGATIVFVDINPDTMNIEPEQVRAALTERTRAIVPVHYGGLPCDMDQILKIARSANLYVVEDAAQSIFSKHRESYTGTIGDFGCLSFHETKNIISGEGGALLISEENFSDLAEIIREKGTDRSRFFRGEVDKYSWQNIGSSYLPGEIIAAFLLAQLTDSERIQEQRSRLWNYYHAGLRKLEDAGLLERPRFNTSYHNSHLYAIKLANKTERGRFLTFMKNRGIQCAFHYVPLHSAPAGQKFGRFHGLDRYTTRESERLVRLPLFYELKESEQYFIMESIHDFFGEYPV